MFSGIVEAQSQIISEVRAPQVTRISIQKPIEFDDLKVGDSICTNGVCLTIEKFDQEQIQLCLGAETLQLLGEAYQNWKSKPVNLERSLRLGDRIHGHLVTGHVDCVAKVIESFQDGECWQMQIAIPISIRKHFWKKGSICLNGVSLTVNEVLSTADGAIVNVCLIPETIKKTNLSQIKKDEFVCVESDYLAKSYLQQKEGAIAELNQ
jgi:riboflavin synthase